MNPLADTISFGRRTDSGGVPIDHAKIRALRIKLNLTQEQAAQRAGVAGRQEWNKIETGVRQDLKVSTLERIAQALGVKPGDLLK
jgi:transcriptional regulator with XRE-family HTH domain